jgi:hypothetical protein
MIKRAALAAHVSHGDPKRSTAVRDADLAAAAPHYQVGIIIEKIQAGNG